MSVKGIRGAEVQGGLLFCPAVRSLEVVSRVRGVSPGLYVQAGGLESEVLSFAPGVAVAWRTVFAVRGSDGERPRPHRGRGAQHLSSPFGERQTDVLAHS